MSALTQDTYISTVDAIYRAALEPANWKEVLRRLASLLDCTAGGLTFENSDSRRGRPVTYFGFDPIHVEKTFAHYLPMNPLFGIADRMQPGFIVRNVDVMPLKTFCKSEFYDGWARPQGLCAPISLVLYRDAATYMPLTLVRPDGTGDVDEQGHALLKRLAPHLLRAAQVGVELERSKTLTSHLSAAFETIATGVIILNDRKRPVFVNHAAERLLDDAANAQSAPFRLSRSCLAARDMVSDRQLQRAIDAVLKGDVDAVPTTIPIQYLNDGSPLLVTLIPLPGSASFFEVEADRERFCLILVKGGSSTVQDIRPFIETFGLTPAEGRVVTAIVGGAGLVVAATKLNVTRATVQTHLKSIFAKTGTRRQAELVNLVRSYAIG
jgi:DNA-binding CsgD family transcriptional regulator/PAS domain-containing protein